MQARAQDVELEKISEDREVLVVRAAGARAPLEVEKFLEAISSDRRLEVVELEVGEVARQLVEAGFVVAIRLGRESLALRTEVVAGLLTERNRIDYIFVSKNLVPKVVRGGVERHGLWGAPTNKNPPSAWDIYPTITESSQAASDHAAVFVDVNI
jgi:hypothetical protein